MRSLRSLAMSTLALVFVLGWTGCPGGGGGTSTVTLQGNVRCPVPPPVVTGTATRTPAGDVVVTATVTCNSIPAVGAVLEGELATTGDAFTHTFPPTDSTGAFTDTLRTRSIPVLPSTVRVVVVDEDGDVVSTQDVTIN